MKHNPEILIIGHANHGRLAQAVLAEVKNSHPNAKIVSIDNSKSSRNRRREADRKVKKFKPFKY